MSVNAIHHCRLTDVCVQNSLEMKMRVCVFFLSFNMMIFGNSIDQIVKKVITEDLNGLLTTLITVTIDTVKTDADLSFRAQLERVSAQR